MWSRAGLSSAHKFKKDDAGSALLDATVRLMCNVLKRASRPEIMVLP